jgi:hypothetical protein
VGGITDPGYASLIEMDLMYARQRICDGLCLVCRPSRGSELLWGCFTHSLRCGLLIHRSLRELVEP